jgi:hypothetical protein
VIGVGRAAGPLIGGISTLCAVAAALSGCAVKQYHEPRPAATRPASLSRPAAGAKTHGRIAATIGVSATLPSTFGTPIYIAGNPAGSGVWIWDGGPNSRTALYFENGQGRLRAWPVLTGAANGGPRGQSGFAVTGHTVWMGINRTVIALDGRTGRVRTWAIPATKALPLAYQGGGAHGRFPAAVQALGVSPDGAVAVAMTQSSAVEVLDLASHSWRQVYLPENVDEPISVGFSAAGVLGVGFANLGTHQSDGLLIARACGTVVTTVRDASEVEPFGGGGFLVGASYPDIVTASGAVSRLATPTEPLDPAGQAEPSSHLPNGQLAFTTKVGVLRLIATSSADAARPATTTLALPQIQCAKLWAGVSIPPGPKTGHRRLRLTGKCDVPIDLMTTDGAGHIWVETQTQPQAISVLRPAA